MDNSHNRKNLGESPVTGSRRAYQAPRIVSREPLEVVAAVCSGANAKANDFDCDSNLLQS